MACCCHPALWERIQPQVTSQEEIWMQSSNFDFCWMKIPFLSSSNGKFLVNYHSWARLLWKVLLSPIPPLLHSGTYTHLPTGTPEFGDPKLRGHLWGCVPHILVFSLLPASYFLAMAGQPRWSWIFSPSSLASGRIKPVSSMPPISVCIGNLCF